LLIAGLVLAGLAALIHVYIFYLESFAWTEKRTLATFGMTAQEAEVTKPLALNQGYYNLFLAIVTGVGIVLTAAGSTAAGAALVLAGAGSMFAASLVLVISDPTKRGAALKQGLVPLLGVIALVIGLAV
jgi:putative membrane protein